MYSGEITVSKISFKSLIRLSEDLEIKGIQGEVDALDAENLINVESRAENLVKDDKNAEFESPIFIIKGDEEADQKYS